MMQILNVITGVLSKLMGPLLAYFLGKRKVTGKILAEELEKERRANAIEEHNLGKSSGDILNELRDLDSRNEH